MERAGRAGGCEGRGGVGGRLESGRRGDGGGTGGDAVLQGGGGGAVGTAVAGRPPYQAVTRDA